MPEVDFALDVQADLELIRDAAAEAGRIALRFFGKSPEVWLKEGQSPVSEADYAVDRFLTDALRSARPDYGWLSEETEDTAERLSASRIFVVDPIDGTRAFIAGQRTWCVSIAVVEGGVPLAGVLDCPATREVFSASRGGGSMQDGRPLSTARESASPRIGGPKAMVNALDEIDRRDVQPVAYIPSLAYRIAMVARGNIAATFVKANSHDWDLAAADVILSEAGGKILGADGRPTRYATTARPSHGPLAAGTAPLVDRMAQVLAKF